MFQTRAGWASAGWLWWSVPWWSATTVRRCLVLREFYLPLPGLISTISSSPSVIFYSSKLVLSDAIFPLLFIKMSAILPFHSSKLVQFNPFIHHNECDFTLLFVKISAILPFYSSKLVKFYPFIRLN